jgi:two-component system phosphate regulon response regulator PhoB
MLFPNPAATSSFCEACLFRQNPTNREPLRFLDIELNWQTQRVTRGKRSVRLSTLHVRLMKFFMLSPGQVFTRAEIISAVWPRGVVVSDQTVDVHVGKLRRALSKDGGSNVIRTVRSRGYALDLDE